MPEFGITQAAQLTGTNPSTLRLWEQHGLLSPLRSPTGQRIYGEHDLGLISTILRLRKVEGLNISAIKRALASTAPAPQDPARPKRSANTQQLGRQFRVARQKHDMSLQEAADATGLPVSFISTFERTGQGAAVASLQRLAACYGTTVTELSAPPARSADSSAHVVRGGKARQAPSFGAGIQIFQLAETLQSLDCQRWVLQPGAQRDGAYSHEGEEFIHVLHGRFHISVQGLKTWELVAGDSISFDSRLLHSWSAAGDEPTVLLWVNTPRSF